MVANFESVLRMASVVRHRPTGSVQKSRYRRSLVGLLQLLIALAFVFAPSAGGQAYAQQRKNKARPAARDTNNPAQWIVPEIDAMEDDTSYYSKEFLLLTEKATKQKLQVSLSYHPKINDLFISMYAYGAGNCIDSKPRLLYLFTDSVRLEIDGTNDFNCDNTARMSPSSGELEVLTTHVLSRVRVYTYEGYVEVALKPDEALAWRTTLRHLAALKHD